MNNDETKGLEPSMTGLPEKPGSYRELLERMTPDIHERLLRAIELGKWENGERLTPTQVEHCMQAVIAYGHRHLPEEQRVGYIDRDGNKGGDGAGLEKRDA